MRRNLLVIGILGLFQLATVRKNSRFALLVIECVDLHAPLGLRKHQRASGLYHFLHALPVFIAFTLAAAAAASIRTPAHSGDAHAHSAASAPASPSVCTARILHLLTRVIAFIVIQLPSSQDRSSRLHLRRLRLRTCLRRRRRLRLCCRQRTSRRLRSRARCPTSANQSQSASRNANP